MPWPPFRVPPKVDKRFIDPRCILNSKILHAFYFSIFVKALNESSTITQHLLSIIIYLLELTLIEAESKIEIDSRRNFLCESKVIDSIVENDFENWFPTDDIIDNFLITVKKVQTCELKFESERFKSKFLSNFLNSLMHDDYNIFRDLYDFTGVENPAIVVENEDEDDDDDDDDDDDVGNSGLTDIHFSDYFDNETNPIGGEDNCNYVSSIEDGEVDSDDEAFMNVINEQLTIGEVDGANGSSNNATQSTSQPSSSQNNSRKSSRSRVSFSKTKPLRFEFDVEESFLSLLLKLYSKFNGKRDSFKPDSAGLASFDLTSRIGDGPYFIGCLLKRFILICAKRLEFQQQMESIDKSDNVTLSSETCFEAVVAIVDKTRRKIWPNVQSNTPEPSSNCQQMSTDEQQPSKPSETNMVVNEDVKPTEFMDIDNEELERVEKKKRALELKQKIMNKFRTMQDEFIQNNKEIDDDKEAGKDTEKSNPINVESGPATTPPSASSSDNSASSPSSSSSSSSNETQVKYEAKSYHCVICGVAGYSTLERSFVQMVLFQSTSVMGNAQANTLSEEISNLECTANDAHQASSSNAPNQKASLTSSIPITEDEYNQFSERKIFANYFENRVDAFYNSFALDSWLSSFNIGWCGGVHAQSCGHLMHMDCYQSYITSVYQNREGRSILLFFSCQSFHNFTC